MNTMKNNSFYTVAKICLRRTIFISLVISALILNNNVGIAQAVKDSASKLTFTTTLSSLSSNGNRSLKVRAKRKENKVTFTVDDIKAPFNIYLSEIKDHDSANAGTRLVGKIYMNNDGEGVFEFPAWLNALTDSLHKYTLIAKMNNDPKYEDAEEQITVSTAKLNIEYAGEDSIKTANASISGWKDKAYAPLSKVELKLCIKRTFNFLPFGEAGTLTDDSGKISGVLPLDVPGNANKTITIAARLEDDETYGTVEVTKDVPWAVLPRVNPIRGRTLWSQGDNAPLPLVISSLVIIVVIWGTIFYLIYLLIKIKKLGKS